MHEENQSMAVPIIAVLMIIVIGIIIFLVARGNSTSDNLVTNPPVSSASTNSKTFTLTSQNSSGQNGTVTLTESGSSTKVTINLSNPITTSEPAHIHLGSCPTPGLVKYSLTNVINGSSITTINAKFSDLQSLGALAVNVHKSAEESSVYVSCGDLNF